MEGGGVHSDIEEKRALKDQVDPKALMNPGKMATYPKNPFAEVAS
jgi:FAD/FMN-containing dehydrogenase